MSFDLCHKKDVVRITEYSFKVDRDCSDHIICANGLIFYKNKSSDMGPLLVKKMLNPYFSIPF